jgi:hypothetical protein
VRLETVVVIKKKDQFPSRLSNPAVARGGALAMPF